MFAIIRRQYKEIYATIKLSNQIKNIVAAIDVIVWMLWILGC